MLLRRSVRSMPRRAELEGVELSRKRQAAIDRESICRALVAHGILGVRRIVIELFQSLTVLALVPGCASLDNSGKDFEAWFYGPTGLSASMYDQHEGSKCSYGVCVIREERSHI